MATVTLHSWREGMQKVEADKLLATEGKLGLTEGKRAIDNLLDDVPTTITCQCDAAAQQLAAKLELLGISCIVGLK